MEKKMSIIDDIRTRYENRNKERLDAEGEREERRSEKKNHGNTKLPYGIAKGKGIDTTGLSPKEVWEKLIGEGVSPKKEYEKLSKASSGKVSSKVKPGSSTMSSKEAASSISSFPTGTKISGGNIKMEKLADNKWTGELYGAPFDDVDDSFMKTVVKGSIHSEFGITVPEAPATENKSKKKPEVVNLKSADMSVKDIEGMENGTIMESGINTYEKVGPNDWKVTTKYGEEYTGIWDKTVHSILGTDVKVQSRGSKEKESDVSNAKEKSKGSVHSEVPEPSITEEKGKKESEVLIMKSSDLSPMDIKNMGIGTKMEDEDCTYEKVGTNSWNVTSKSGEKYTGIWDIYVHSLLDSDVTVQSKGSFKVQSKGSKGIEPDVSKQKKESTPKSSSVEVDKEVAELKSQFRKAKIYGSPQEADDDLRDTVGAVWSELSYEQKGRIAAYTGGSYQGINKSLCGQKNHFMLYEENIKQITNMIDKTALSEDTILYRGVGYGGFSSMFKLDKDSLDSLDAGSLVGLIGRNDGFSSCGTVKGKGFTYKPVQMRILCPKGTKAAYAEPWSLCGNGDGKQWDGKSKQSSFSSEDETILQRGTSFKIIRAERVSGKLVVDVAVVGQDAKPIDELKKSYGW